MQRPPLITVLIPTYNRPQYLTKTVRSALAQTYPAVEIVLSDNCSTDETPRVAESFADRRVTFVRQSVHLSMTTHWNACLAKASGELAILLSDDDVLRPEALQELSAPLVRGAAEFSYTPFTEIDENDSEMRTSAPGPALEPGDRFIRLHARKQRLVMPSGLLFRTDSVRSLGGFPDIGTASDFAVRLALATRGNVACVRTPLVYYRRHSGALSAKHAQVIASHLSLVAWAGREPCMAPHRELIEKYVRHESLVLGVLAGLAGDRAGTRAANDAIRALRESQLSAICARALVGASQLNAAKHVYRRWKSLRNATRTA